MIRLIFSALFSLIAFSAIAADNTLVVTPGVGLTIRSKDIGSGVQTTMPILGDASGNSIYGTAGSSNANVISVQGIASGTALPASQSGTWTVQPGNTANTTPWLATIAQGGNSAVVKGASATPGASDPALTVSLSPNSNGLITTGTAGAASSQVVTVQGIASMTALTVSGTISGTGTAGSAASGVMTVQGIASMTPVQVSQATAASLNATVVGTGTFAVQAAQSGTWNVGTVTTVTTLSTLTGGGVASAAADSGNPIKIGGKYNASPITLTDGNRGDLQLDVNGYVKVNVVTATGLAQGSTTSGQTGSLVMAAVTTAVPAYTTAQTSPLSMTTDGALRVASNDPCQNIAKTYTPVSIASATTTRIIAPAASKKTYICSMILTAAAAINVGIVEGTGGTCGSGTAGVIGGTTAATGPNLLANGGFVIGSGGNAVAATAGTNVDFCLITSAASQLTGHVVWVQL